MGIYNNVKSSLLKYCNDYIIANSLTGSFDVFDFDAHASINDLPDQHLLGIGEYGLRNEQETYIGTVAFIVCTRADDTNLGVMNMTIDSLFERLRPDTSIAAVRGDNGQIIGNIKLQDPVEAFPVARTKGRPFQLIQAQFATGLIVPP